MTGKQLEDYLHAQIPLTAHMQVRVDDLGPPGLSISAPLAPNANLHGTAFGGSIASLAVLAGWSLLHIRTAQAGLKCSLVVQKSEVSYQRPIHADFSASCAEPSRADWERFLSTLAKRGRARIGLAVTVYCGEHAAATLQATYAAETPTPELRGPVER